MKLTRCKSRILFKAFICITDQSNFCTILATGLSGLYYELPRHLDTDSPWSWHRLDHDTVFIISSPPLLATWIKFILTESVDGENILINRLNSSGQVCVVTLQLFETLVSLNLEDIMVITPNFGKNAANDPD